ncbi:MAG: hemolysin family protein [Ignavibacteriaceae bacterium]
MDDVGWQSKLILLFIFLLLSAFFSGSEVALFSLDRRKLKNNLNENQLIFRYLINLLDNPRRLLVTILIGNTIFNVGASIIGVSLALDYSYYSGISEELALTLQIIILTILVLLFGEVTPKLWASKNPIGLTKIAAIPLYWISVFLYPISETFTEAIKSVVSKIKFDKAKMAILPEEISELANLGHERGTIIEEEHGLIQSIVKFRSVAVHEVMTPRVDMIAIPSDTDFNRLLEIITSSGHSRIPLFQETLDEVIGIIYAKDILPYLRNETLKSQLSLSKVARKAMFIPQSKMINDLMHEFQEKKMHIAIVVDEYGGTAGLITLEDIIEEIIGEIRDEYDKEENPVTKLDDNSFLVLGKLSIDELNELFNINITPENEDYETVGGMVLNYAGQIPKEGYTFRLENYKFTVKEVFNKRIKKVLVEIVQGE